MTVLKSLFRAVLPSEPRQAIPPLARKIGAMRAKSIAYNDDDGFYFSTPYKQTANNNFPATRLGAAISVGAIIEAWRCYTLRSQRVGSIRWQIKRSSDGTVYEDYETQRPTHKLARALWRSQKHFKENLFAEWQASLVSTGEAFIEYVPDTNGMLAGLRVLEPLAIRPNAYNGIIESYDYMGAQEMRRFEVDDILFDRYRHPTSKLSGRSPMEVAIGTANVLYNLERFVIASYANNGAMGTTLAPKLREDALTDEEVKSLSRIIRQQYEGVDNASRTLVSPIPMDIAMHDAPDMTKNVPLGTYSQNRLFVAFGVPRSLAGDWDSTQYKSDDKAEAVFNRVTIIPELDNIKLRLNNEVMPRFDSSGDFYFDFEKSHLEYISEDDLNRAELANRIWQGGLGTLNEARNVVGLAPLETSQGDAFYAASPATDAPPLLASPGDTPRVNQLAEQVSRVESALHDMQHNRFNHQKATQSGAVKQYDGVMICLYLGEGIASEYHSAAQSSPLRDVVAAQDMHITLGYIGGSSEQLDIKTLYKSVKAAAQTMQQIRVTLAERIGRFTNTHNGDCIYASVGGYEVHEAHRSLGEVLALNGLLISRRSRYVPHVTLGYLDETAPTPEIELRELEVGFTVMSLVIGEARYDFPIGFDPNDDGGNDSDQEDLPDEPAPSKGASKSNTSGEGDDPPVVACHDHEHAKLPESVKSALADLDAYRRKVRKRGDKAATVGFESDAIDAALLAHIKDTLLGEQDREIIDDIFFSAEHDARIMHAYTYDDDDSKAKSVVAFRRRIRGALRRFWDGRYTLAQLGAQIEDFIARAYRSAFRNGLQSQGVKLNELDDNDLQILEQRIALELSHVPKLLDALEGQTRENGAKLQDLRDRLRPWINRYDNVYELGVLVGAGGKRLMWVYDPRKEHCEDCARLNGYVYTAKTWLTYDIMPRSWRLQCFGIYCGCRFVETDKAIRRGRPPKLKGSPLKSELSFISYEV